MFAYFFINLAFIGFNPIKSSETKICPSQYFEAPIPIVGILISSAKQEVISFNNDYINYGEGFDAK